MNYDEANDILESLIARLSEHALIENKPKLGTGTRFKKLKNKLAHEKGIKHPGALAAFIGRKKFGAKKMGKLAAHGKK